MQHAAAPASHHIVHQENDLKSNQAQACHGDIATVGVFFRAIFSKLASKKLAVY